MTANLLKPIIYGIAAVFYLAVLVLCFASPATVKKINTGVHKVMLVLSEIALALMIVIVFITVVLRYCFNTGIGWAEEVPRLLVNFFAFCACAIGVRDHLHISVNIFYNLFAKDGIVRKCLDVLYNVAILACSVFMFVYGTQYSVNQFFQGGQLPMTGWGTFIRYIPAAIAGFVMIFDTILFLTRTLTIDDLLYSEKEVDYTEMVKQNKAEAALQTSDAN